MLGKIKNVKRFDLISLIVSSIAICITLSLAHKMFLSDFSIMSGDLYDQYVPLYRNFINKLFIHNDLGGQGTMSYSNNIGYGYDFMSYIANDAMLSPFNIIFLLCKNNNMACCLLIVAKLSMSAFFFQRFESKVFGVDGIQSVGWAVAYSMCGYSSIFYINVQFLDGVLILPVISYLCYELVDTCKAENKLALAYLYLFVTNFYSGYIIGIFTFIYWLLMVMHVNRDRKMIVVKYLKAVFLAFGLSAIVIVPAAYEILSSIVEDRTIYDGTVASLDDIFANLFIGMNQGLTSLNPYIYSGILSVMLVPLFFVNNKIEKCNKVIWGGLLLFLFLCMTVPFMYIAMHCFDNPDIYTYRFVYLVSFVLISIGCQSLKQVQVKKGVVIIEVIALICFGGFYIFINDSIENMFICQINLTFILIYGGALLYKANNKNMLMYYFASLTIIEALLNFYLIAINIPSSYMSYKAIMNDIEDKCDKAVMEIKKSDNSIYRIYIPNAPSLDYQSQMDYYGGTYFSSFENSNVRKTMNGLGMLTSARLLTDYGITAPVKMILGYKYDVLSNGIVVNTDIDTPIITENEKNLGLAYMTNDNIRKIDFSDKENVFDNINELLSALVGTDIKYFDEPYLDIERYLWSVSVNEAGNGYNRLMLDEGAEVGAMSLEFTGDDDYYAYIPYPVSSYRDDDPFVFSSGGDYRNIHFIQSVYAPKIIEIEKNNEGYNNLIFQIEKSSSVPYLFYRNIYIVKANEEELDITYNLLKDNVMRIDKFEDGYIEGDVLATKELNTLFVSIAYSKWWEIYVDGEKQECIPGLNNTFITCDLFPGEHHIVLKYNNRILIVGAAISLVSLLLMSISIMAEKGRSKLFFYERHKQ